MTTTIGIESLWAMFLVFSMLAIISYLRIVIIVKTIDQGLENPPVRKQIQDKLRAYREWCKDRNRSPILLYTFAAGVICATIAWLPLPWIILK